MGRLFKNVPTVEPDRSQEIIDILYGITKKIDIIERKIDIYTPTEPKIIVRDIKNNDLLIPVIGIFVAIISASFPKEITMLFGLCLVIYSLTRN